LIRIEGDEIWTKITNSWSNSDKEVSLLEMELVVNTITCVLVNTSKHINALQYFCNLISTTEEKQTGMQQNLQIKEKNTKITESCTKVEADKSLRQHFHEAHFKDLIEPTTILDCHGKVIVWALASILHPNCLVSKSAMYLLHK
jgi:hypothetical protein